MFETGERLILFTRYPRAGAVKTRLIGALSAGGAKAVHRRLAEHAAAQMRLLTVTRSVVAEVCYTGGSRAQMTAWLGRDLVYRSQTEGDLGARLDHTFAAAFDGGARTVIIMGSDCPGLTAQVLTRAFDRLAHNDIVLGPAGDGGYYLIGLNRHTPELFTDIPWGTDAVLDLTTDQARRLELQVAILETLADVDRPEDLQCAAALLAERPLVWEQRGDR